ncbi:hypothetical protein [Alkalibacterium sp. 20]|uniref:hypothetical protein n=1 Tax=Alkalibacterium sp. 20 TaxID=1798803 RepID=UPI0008FFFF7E|nr:hypothetical protein [Alkalibacterium sp. 20]OJF92125.1 hypothetical protein AX762_02670 [Alkalibacterium sp. 20]
MKKILGTIVLASAFFLGACNRELEPPKPNNYGEIDVEENMNEGLLTETDTKIRVTLTNNE